jgi:hypothetical protein
MVDLYEIKYLGVIGVFIDAYISPFMFTYSNQTFIQEPKRGTCVCVLVGVILWYSWDSDNIFMCDKVFNSVFIASLGINECLYYDHLVSTILILFA